MGDGCGYFMKRYGEDGYNAHIAKHANAKRTKGSRMTGVWGVTCSRHKMWHANGIGDLQCGESMRSTSGRGCLRYRNAYGSNLCRQMCGGRYLFHLPDHNKRCHPAFSFHWMPGAGKSHGSMRLMGPGSRQATLEDVFGFHNYDRLLAMHRVLPKRLAVAMIGAGGHKAMLDAFTNRLEKDNPEQVKRWRALVDEWESKQHKAGEKSPFEGDKEVTTLHGIQLEIAKEELTHTKNGDEVEHEHTPGSFISIGVEIQEAQQRLTVNVSAIKDPTAMQTMAFTKRRTALLKHIHKFR
ncbi:hypothetical protein K438DRAFT_1784222 [Mycena galopus ATCC 62051]|nr:hypothetical protein K438DRAFT_1784222 [Mycena galopus ATCC 62051]